MIRIIYIHSQDLKIIVDSIREKNREIKGGGKAGRKKSGGQTLGAIEDEWWQQTVAVTRKEREKKTREGRDGQRQSRKLKYM